MDLFTNGFIIENRNTPVQKFRFFAGVPALSLQLCVESDSTLTWQIAVRGASAIRFDEHRLTSFRSHLVFAGGSRRFVLTSVSGDSAIAAVAARVGLRRSAVRLWLLADAGT